MWRLIKRIFWPDPEPDWWVEHGPQPDLPNPIASLFPRRGHL
jgi:hypothetical protein